jgi:hypothetical protein
MAGVEPDDRKALGRQHMGEPDRRRSDDGLRSVLVVGEPPRSDML